MPKKNDFKEKGYLAHGFSGVSSELSGSVVFRPLVRKKHHGRRKVEVLVTSQKPGSGEGREPDGLFKDT